MSRPLRLFVYGLLALVPLCALCALGLLGPLSPSAHGSEVATTTLRKRPGQLKAAPSSAVISEQRLVRAEALLTLPLAQTGPWQRPTLAAVLAQTTPAPPPPSPDSDPNAPTGSYGCMTANDIGIPNPASHLRGTLQNRLTLCYPRSVQQEQNIALLLASPSDDVEGYFSLQCDSPGWYLITFHLANCHPEPCSVHTKVLTGWPMSPEVLIDDSRTVAAQSAFVVPILVEINQTGAFRMALDPHADSGSMDGHLIFQALTIDRL